MLSTAAVPADPDPTQGWRQLGSEMKLHRAKFREAKLRTKLRLETLAIPTRNETSRNFTEDGAVSAVTLIIPR